MKLSSTWLCSLLPLAAACAGGGSALRVVPQSISAPFDSQSAFGQNAIRLSAATPVPVSTDLLYVANAGNNSITVYDHDASGNTAPIKIISGSKTGIAAPGQLSEDAAGNLYVSNNVFNSYTIAPNILVFAHGANGNVKPIRNLLIPGIGNIYEDTVEVMGMTVDQATGKIFVARAEEGTAGVVTLLRFPPDATGNEPPYAISAEFAEETPEIASDPTGERIIAPQNVGDDCYCSPSGVDVVAKQFPNGSNPYLYGFNLPCYAYNDPPCYGPNYVGGVADDPTTKTYVVSTGAEYGTSGILRFSESANTYKPISTITTAANCGALALGYLRNIYAVCGTNKINVYEHDASGAAKPLRVLNGSATKLNSPVGIYEGK